MHKLMRSVQTGLPVCGKYYHCHPRRSAFRFGAKIVSKDTEYNKKIDFTKSTHLIASPREVHSSSSWFISFSPINGLVSFVLCPTMAIDHAERILNIFVISHGFVTLNFRHHWKWWQTTLFVLAVGFSAFGFLREVGNFAIGYSRSKSIGKGIVGSAIFWAKILGDTWGGFAVTWGIVKRKEMAKARIILEEIDHSIAQLDLQQEGGWIHRRRRTQWHMKLFFILQILLMALRTAMIIYGIIKDPSYFQWEFAFDAIYKYGVVSMYFLYISFIYHKIILRYREINQMLLRLREIDIQRQPAKIMSLTEMRKLTGSLVVVINSFFAVPVSDRQADDEGAVDLLC